MTRIRPGLTGAPSDVDLLVIGLGVTGAGAALDGTTRGLRTLAVDAHDLAFGTSRWSSKLVHGGLRYLATLQVGIARESAHERELLMSRIAPHLIRPLPMLVPLGTGMGWGGEQFTRSGIIAGDVLRRAAGTDGSLLPGPRKIGAAESLALAPSLRRDGLRGGLLSYDGQLEDDARLVTTIARTAAAYGADVRTRAKVLDVRRPAAHGPVEVRLLDGVTGEQRTIRARGVLNATGVWAAGLDDRVRLRPSRGSHLVLRAERLGNPTAAVTVPVPGSRSRFVMMLPQPDGTVYVGLTDEPVDEVADVPRPSEVEIGFLLDVVGAALEVPLRREDLIGAYAGLRPLLYADDGRGKGDTSELSRDHAVITSPAMVSVVGGKLTTYRRMAADGIDAVLAATPGLDAGRCRTEVTPLLGAAPRETLAVLAATGASARLVRRFGTEAERVLDVARSVTGLGTDELLAPAAPEAPVTLAELVFGVTHEGAYGVEDLLDRRTRVGLVPEDRRTVAPMAERALTLARTGAPTG